jgi:hypothetical protein
MMTELELAAQRLEQAVARLEAASRRSGDRKAPARTSGPSSDTAGIVAARLDDAIVRIDRLLES